MNIIPSQAFVPASEDQGEQPSIVQSFQPVALAARIDGWTPERQRQFIEELADCGIVREAAARVGMSEQGAYQLRRRPDAAGFNQAWDAAVQLGVHRLHSTAFERAIRGTVRRRYYNGEVVGEDTVFDNRLLIYLLARLDRNPDRVRGTASHWHETLEALDEGLARPLPEPGGHRAPVWRGEEGEWLTSFSPPEGFSGEQWGDFGDEDYCRTLSEEEGQAIEAHQACLARKAAHQRDRYFARLNGEVSDPVSLNPSTSAGGGRAARRRESQAKGPRAGVRRRRRG